MRGLVLVACAASLMFLTSSYGDAVAVPVGSVAGLAVTAACAWIAFCVLLIRAIAVGGAESSE